RGRKCGERKGEEGNAHGRRRCTASRPAASLNPSCAAPDFGHHVAMNVALPRRTFLKTAATAGTLVGLGELDFLQALPRVSAAEAAADPKFATSRPEIEPLVRLLEDTSRSRLLEEVGARVKSGTSYREVLAALLLAGVRNIQPRPVGFKFHAVLVVNSAH